MNWKYLILSMPVVLSVWSCSPEDGTADTESGGDSPKAEVKEFTLSVDGEYPSSTERLGAVLVYSDGAVVSDEVLPAERTQDGSFTISVEPDAEKSVSDIICFYPYRQALDCSDGIFRHRVGGLQYPSQTVPDEGAMVYAGTGHFDAASVARVSMTELLEPWEFKISGMNASEKLYWTTLAASDAIAGDIDLTVDGDALGVKGFSPDGSGSSLTAAFVSGTDSREFSLLTAGGIDGIAGYTVVTGDRIYEGVASGMEMDIASAENVYEAMTYDFTSSSDALESFVPEESGSEIVEGKGIRVSGDPVNPGTVYIPTIEGRQITRIICLPDRDTDCEPHLMWLEAYNGETWDKVIGTDKLVSSAALAKSGGVLDFVFPKESVSAKGVYRIAKATCEDDVWITDIAVAHEEETCSHDPRSILADGYSSGWTRTGTSSNEEKGYDAEACHAIDMEVSHVDDGSGSLRIGGVQCEDKTLKPWQGWRYADMSVNPGETYEIYFCIKAENVPDGANIFLSLGFKDNKNQWLTGWVDWKDGFETASSLNVNSSQWVDTVKGTHDWMKLKGQITVPEGAVKMSYFQIQVQNFFNNPEAYVWVDDFNVVKIN